jgi:hypothetical protein
MEITTIIALTLTYLAGIAWFSLAQWIAIELDGERRIGVSIRVVLAAVWPLTILVATCAVLARQVYDHHSAAAPVGAATSVEPGASPSKTSPDALIRLFSPKDVKETVR